MKITEKYLHFNDQQIPYQIISGKPGKLGIRVLEDGSLAISSANRNLAKWEINFILKKAKRIYNAFCTRQEKFIHRQNFLRRIPHEIPFKGLLHTVQFQSGSRLSLKQLPNKTLQITVPEQLSSISQKEILYRALRDFATPALRENCLYRAKACNLHPQQIKVKHHKSRWGSCSSKGNINLNWQLIFLPPDLADYVIVHELMHLIELNHSPAFWKLVEKWLPHYKVLRNQLRKKEWLIDILPPA